MHRHGTGTSVKTLGVLGVTALFLFGFWTWYQADGAAADIVNGAFAALSSALQKIIADPEVLVTLPISWLQEHFNYAPTLVLGLGALFMVPVVSAFFGLVRAFQDELGKHEFSAGKHGPAGEISTAPNAARSKQDVEDLYIPRHAILEVAEGLGARHIRRVKISRPVVQIGRSDDVDIKLNDAAVHRYHAAIERSDCSGYLIVDLSAGTGNGVVVNGRPTLNHALHDGDEICIGHTKLRFATVTG